MDRTGSDIRADILIGGAGFAGLALAAALAKAGLSVAVADPALARPEHPDSRALTLVAGVRRMLEVIGAWPAISREAEAVRAMEITDSRLADLVRPALLSFAEEAAPGEPFAHVAPNGAIRLALLDAARAAGATLIPAPILSCKVAGLRAFAQLGGDGRSVSAGLMVAADGARSPLRRMARIRTHGWRYDHAAIITTLALEHPHEGVAVQHFVGRGTLALLPLPGQRASVVWAEPRLEAERLSALPDADFMNALQQRAGLRFGELHLAGPRGVRPLALSVAHRFVGERLALIGDAAHSMHPIAGQGLNLGLRDVAALAEAVVDAARLGQDPGSDVVLGRYESWRRFDTLAMLSATDGLIRLFGGRSAPVRLLRDTGLGVVDRLPWLKSAFVQSAAGLSGDVPRLLRGEAL